MALSDKHRNFLVLTTESGSPHHPFVKSLRRLLGLAEIVEHRSVQPDGSIMVTKPGETLPATEADVAKVLEHHNHPAEQGPLYDERKPAIEALLKGHLLLAAPAPAEPPPAKDPKPSK